VLEIAGVDAVTGVDGTGGVAGIDGDVGIDGLGAVHALVVGLGAEIGGRGVAPSAIHDLLMWATALTFSIRSTYRHSVARLEGFLKQDRRASADGRAAGWPLVSVGPLRRERADTGLAAGLIPMRCQRPTPHAPPISVGRDGTRRPTLR
jgi:hypothetical protein